MALYLLLVTLWQGQENQTFCLAASCCLPALQELSVFCVFLLLRWAAHTFGRCALEWCYSFMAICTKSDESNCVKYEKRELRGRFTPCFLSLLHTSGMQRVCLSEVIKSSRHQFPIKWRWSNKQQHTTIVFRTVWLCADHCLTDLLSPVGVGHLSSLWFRWVYCDLSQLPKQHASTSTWKLCRQKK